MSTQARKALRKWSEQHVTMLEAIDQHVAACDPKALDQLERATVGLSTTNCWFATYAIKDTILDAIKRERYRRKTTVLPPEASDR